MNNQTAQIIPFSAKDAIQVVDGKPITTSTAVAERFQKHHKDVLRAVRQLDCSPEFNERNFALVDFLDSKGEKRPMYRMTRDGFVFLCMGFTGAEAAKWKEAYINAFNEMEKALAEPEHITPEQQNALQQIIDRLAAGDNRKRPALWSRFNNHFRLGSYKQLPSGKFTEAVSYLDGLTGEYLPKQDLPNALHQLPKAGSSPLEFIFSAEVAEARERVYKWLDQCRAAMKAAGVGEPGWPDIDATDFAHAAILEQVRHSTFALGFNAAGNIDVSVIPRNAAITTPEQIPHLIKMGGAVPPNVLPKIIEAVASRMK